MDTKKKELIGNFKNAGQSWGPHAERVNVHDFPSDAAGRAVPYGIYDQQHNCGTIYVGQSADTPTFAVDNIVRWCETEKPVLFPNTTELLIEADSGGSNSARSRVWKQGSSGIGGVSVKRRVPISMDHARFMSNSPFYPTNS